MKEGGPGQGSQSFCDGASGPGGSAPLEAQLAARVKTHTKGPGMVVGSEGGAAEEWPGHVPGALDSVTDWRSCASGRCS